MTKYHYIRNNFGEVNKLVKNGLISTTTLNDFFVYECYLNHSNVKSKMQRYRVVSIEMGICTKAVTNAINRINSVMR